jgi:hypothetical protein
MGKQSNGLPIHECVRSPSRVHWCGVLLYAPLILTLIAGCSAVDVVKPPPQADTLLASASTLDQSPHTDFAIDQVAQDSAHASHRRTCWKTICDAFTRPWYGNYLGPDNLGYDKKPIDELDAAAREHDLAYDQYHVAGLGGALLCLDAGRADRQLARRAFLALPSLDFGGKLMGVATGIAMGFLGIVKAPFAELRDAFHHKSSTADATPVSASFQKDG